MRLVVADTGPLNYLVWIDAVDILPRLFDRVIIPQIVRDELLRPATPEPVRIWAAHPPEWLEVRTDPASDIPGADFDLDDGERAAIALAVAIGPDLVLIDDRVGVAAALAAGLETIGTLGILERAAKRGLIDLRSSFERLKQTSFRYPPDLMERLLAQNPATRQ